MLVLELRWEFLTSSKLFQVLSVGCIMPCIFLLSLYVMYIINFISIGSIDQIDMNCPLRFHPRCGLFVRVINAGKTALRPKYMYYLFINCPSEIAKHFCMDQFSVQLSTAKKIIFNGFYCFFANKFDKRSKVLCGFFFLVCVGI